MINIVITSVLSNPALTILVIGILVSILVLIFKQKPLAKGAVVEVFFSYYLLFSIGINYLVNFILHVFFGGMIASFIGWADSPFQLEVGFASLGFAVVGFMSFRGSFGMRAAAVIGPAFFLLGAAGGHIYQMLKTHNFSPGNAGTVFWMDIILPAIGFILLYYSHKSQKK
jgi:hypothetical protein